MGLFEVMARIALDTSAYEKGLDEASKKTQSFGGKLNTALEKVGTAVKTGMKAASAAAVAFGVSSVKTGADFDKAMSKVGAISGATGKDFDALRKKAQEMGEKTQFSATESANAFEYMAMAGWKTDDMIDGIAGIMNLAAASGEDLATTSDIVTDALTAFGLQSKDSGHFADLLAVASSNANTNVSMMGETFKYVAPVAGALGVSAEDTAEAIGLMANAGIKSSQAGTILRSIMTRLSTDAGASSKSLGALGTLTKELGVDFYDSKGKVRDFGKILSEARKQWKNLSSEDASRFAKKIAGQEGISGWLALMNAAPNDINKLQKAIEECDGAAEDMANTRLDNLSGDVTILKSAFEGLQIAVSDKVSPALRKFVQAATTGLGDITKAIKSGNLSKAFDVIGESLSKAVSKVEKVGGELLDKVVSGIKNNATKIGPAAMDVVVNFSAKLREKASNLIDAGLKLIMSLADGLIKNIPTLIKTVPTIISNLAGIINDNAPKLLKSGAELIIKLAKGVIDAIPTLVKEFPKIVKAIIDVWTAVNWLSLGTKLITGIVNGVKSIAKNIPDALKSIGENAKEVFKSVDWKGLGKTVIDFISKAATGAKELISKALKVVGEKGTEAFKAVDWKAVGKKAVDFISKAAKGAFELAKTALTFVGKKAIEAFRSVDWAAVGKKSIKFIGDAAKSAFNLAVTALKYVGNQAKEAFKDVDWKAVGKKAIELIGNAAKGAFDLVKSALTFVANQAKSAFTNIDWAELGRNVVRGIARGIGSLAREAYDAAKNMAQGVLNKIAGTFDENSPSKETEKQAKYLVEGIIIGINKNKKYAKKSAEELAKIVLSESEKRLKTEKVLKNLSIADEVIYWDVIRKSIQSGTKAQLDAEKKYIETKKKLNESIVSDAEQQLNNRKVYNDVSLKQEADYWDKIRKLVKKGTQARIDADAKYFEAKKAYVQQIKEQEKEAAQSTLNQWTEAVTLLRGTNGKITESGNKLYASLTQNVAKIKSLAKKAGVDYNSVLLEAADKRLSNAKSMREVDLEEEMIYWGKVSKAIKKGTQARIDADAKYKDAMKAYRESIQKVADEADTMADSFTKSIDEINKALDNSRKDAWDKYSSAIASRESSLVSTVKLFDQFKATDLPTYSGVIGYDDEGKEILGEWEATTDDIINNLHKQLVAVDEWDKTLDSLEQRVGNNEVLVDAFRNMGFDSYQTLKKINDMTDEQLQTYVAEFEMIQAKMHNRAKAENEDLRKATEENIATMESDAKEQIATLEKSYNDKISELAKTLKESSSKVGNNIIKGTSNGIKDKLEDIKTAALKIASKVESTKSQAKSSGKNIGSKISEGIEQGIRSGQSGIASTARSAALAAYNAAKQALDIHSPSRKFAWIGQMVDEGFAQGIDKNSNSVENAISSLGNITPFPSPSDWSTATATVPSGAVGNNTTTITMNIYGAQGQDVRTLADEVERRLNAKVARGGVAFA